MNDSVSINDFTVKITPPSNNGVAVKNDFAKVNFNFGFIKKNTYSINLIKVSDTKMDLA